MLLKSTRTVEELKASQVSANSPKVPAQRHLKVGVMLPCITSRRESLFQLGVA